MTAPANDTTPTPHQARLAPDALATSAALAVELDENDLRAIIREYVAANDEAIQASRGTVDWPEWNRVHRISEAAHDALLECCRTVVPRSRRVAQAAVDLVDAYTLLRLADVADVRGRDRHASKVVRARNILIGWAGR
jgi:hypothetical protein